MEEGWLLEQPFFHQVLCRQGKLRMRIKMLAVQTWKGFFTNVCHFSRSIAAHTPTKSTAPISAYRFEDFTFLQSLSSQLLHYYSLLCSLSQSPNNSSPSSGPTGQLLAGACQPKMVRSSSQWIAIARFDKPLAGQAELCSGGGDPQRACGWRP